MSAQDELAKLLQAASKAPCPISFWSEAYNEPTGYGKLFVRAILAAGYQKPRTVTTVKELDALPIGSVMLDRFGTAWQVCSDVTDGTEIRYEGTSGNVYYTTGVFTPLYGPFVVLHEPSAS